MQQSFGTKWIVISFFRYWKYVIRCERIRAAYWQDPFRLTLCKELGMSATDCSRSKHGVFLMISMWSSRQLMEVLRTVANLLLSLFCFLSFFSVFLPVCPCFDRLNGSFDTTAFHIFYLNLSFNTESRVESGPSWNSGLSRPTDRAHSWSKTGAFTHGVARDWTRSPSEGTPNTIPWNNFFSWGPNYCLLYTTSKAS